jgi:hypothetical protein
MAHILLMQIGIRWQLFKQKTEKDVAAVNLLIPKCARGASAIIRPDDQISTDR